MQWGLGNVQFGEEILRRKILRGLPIRESLCGYKLWRDFFRCILLQMERAFPLSMYGKKYFLLFKEGITMAGGLLHCDEIFLCSLLQRTGRFYLMKIKKNLAFLVEEKRD